MEGYSQIFTTAIMWASLKMAFPAKAAIQVCLGDKTGAAGGDLVLRQGNQWRVANLASNLTAT
jgi:hypothetical protein